MSTATKAWRVDVGGGEHDVEAEHREWTGKIMVKLDGQDIAEDRMIFRSKHIEFDIDGHPAELRFKNESKYGGWTVVAECDLHVGGKVVEPLRR